MFVGGATCLRVEPGNKAIPEDVTLLYSVIP